MSTWTDQLEDQGGVPTINYLLQEDGFYLLLEDDGRIIIDESPAAVIWTDQNEN